MSRLKVFKRASIVKLIHGWILTNESLYFQGHKPPPLCPWCQCSVEIIDHICQCLIPSASSCHKIFLQQFLKCLININTPMQIIVTLERKLSLTLDIPYDARHAYPSQDPATIPHSLITTIQHQNIIGWDVFIKGYTSNHWMAAYVHLHISAYSTLTLDWDVKLVSMAIALYKGIWDDRNIDIHGKSRLESQQKLRAIEKRLNRSTNHLQHCLSRVFHHSHVSKTILWNSENGQHSIHQNLGPQSAEVQGPCKHPPWRYHFKWVVQPELPHFLQHP